MSIQNTFPVFEPDQVLTNNHLNDMLNYLEQQERMTRCKLLGSGIVCGLEITFQQGPDNEDSIEISKGCGLTSQGYIITLCDSIYKRYIPYSRKNFPEHLKLLLQCGQETDDNKINFYGEGSDNSVLELITEKVFDELDNDGKKNVKLLNQNKKIKMDSYAVVLFLEAEEIDLKNCDTNDCNDKGSRMEFEVKALLVDKALLREKRGSTNKPVLHHIELRRYNVPVNDLKSADDVLNEFDRLTDDTTIKILSEDLSYCYENYKYLLKDENTNPFTSLNSDLQKHKKFILKDFPVLIQYFYDFVDDLIKAFYEFKHKVYDVMSECCGDEMKFPFHLMLGKATGSTASGDRSEYRQYFIYSPLFDSQNSKLNEIRCLFTRMKLMYEEFLLTGKQFKENRGFLEQAVKITPSRYGHAYLSDRCIPYYYDVTDKGKELYQYWNYSKTRRGNARFNLSYNSNKYSSSAPVVTPLEYDTERFNFFRIEGHIGKSINTAMPEVKKIQQVNNLPFDIIPLSADLFGTLLRGEDPKCIIQDLESDYRVLIAEFICKLHEVFCFYSGLAFRKEVSFIGSTVGTTRSAASGNEIEYAKILMESASKKNVNLNQTFASLLVNRFQASKTYRKGDTLSELCEPAAGTIGSVYLKNVKNNIFKNPVGNQNDFQFHIFEFMDRIENMFLILMSNELSELNISGFKKEYEKFEEEAKWLGIVQLLILGVIESKKTKETQLEDFWSDFTLDMLVYNSQRILHTCFLERLKALKDEYERRVAQYRLAKNFNYYFKHHGGVEHKAGVPVGGTFILVYHEERRNRLIDVSSVFINKELGTLMLSRFQNLLKPSVALSEIEFNTKLLQVSTLYRDPELYLRFKDVMSKYLDDCKDLPKAKRKIIQDIIDKPPVQSHFDLKDGMVIADFYVPYMCCSDCPPVAYILPPPPKDETKNPTIKIEGKNFCDNDKTEFPITVTPAGGIITGDGVKVRADGSFVFVPLNVSPGMHTITYTANGKSVSVTVQVTSTPQPKYSFETNVQDGLMTVFLKNESTGTDDQTTYDWLLDGTKFSDKKDPDPVKFKVQSLPHTILLKESNLKKCPNEFSAEIKLETEDRQISVCKNADELPLEPNLSTTDTIKVLSNDGIKMKNKSLMILPAATSVNQTNVFHVSYTINGKQVNVTITLIVVNADFTMKLEHNPSPIAVLPTILTLNAKQDGADKYAWKLTTVTGSGIDFFTKDVEINLSQINIPAGTQLNIFLTVSIMDQSGSACEDTKEFVLTRDLFNKHLNKGEFDNLTTS